MYVRWQARKRKRPAFGGMAKEDMHRAASLVEIARVKGKPTQRHVAYLGGITDSAIAIPAQRRVFWQNVFEVLHRLSNQITAEQRQAIIAALAAKVPGPPAEAECAELDKERAEMLDFIAKEFGALNKIINPKPPPEEKVLSEGITVDDVLWRLSQLAYEADQRKMLRELAQSTGIGIKKLRTYAGMWRVWMADGDKRR
jgi:hypothetical protein